MVAPLSMVFMVVTTLVCVVVPVGALVWLATRRAADGSRRWPHVGRAFGCGVLAFVLAQVVTRLPLMAVVVPQLPEPPRGSSCPARWPATRPASSRRPDASWSCCCS